MKTKLNEFFKKIDKIGIDYKSSVLFDMSKLLLEYDTVLSGHVILEENQKMSTEGKKIIRSRTKSEMDYYQLPYCFGYWNDFWITLCLPNIRDKSYWYDG